jgi:hypothetical protein
MQRQIGAYQMRLASEDGVGLDCGAEIFAEQRIQACLDVAPQRLAHINLLPGNRQLHGLTPFGRGAEAIDPRSSEIGHAPDPDQAAYRCDDGS